MSSIIGCLLLPLFLLLFVGGCTASLASPIASPIGIMFILFFAACYIPISRCKKARVTKIISFVALGFISNVTLAIAFLLKGFSSEYVIAIIGVIIGVGIGLISRARNIYRPGWLYVIKSLTEPIALSFIFGYLIIGSVPWAVFLFIFANSVMPIELSAKSIDDAVWAPFYLAFFHILGGFLVIAIPAILIRGYLDTCTFVTRSSSYKWPEQINKDELYNLSWIVTLIFFLAIFTTIICCYAFTIITVIANLVV